MTPIAIVHQMPGRARLRAREQRGNAEWFDRVETTLAGCPGVKLVETNVRTGSVLLRHSGKLDSVLEFARERELFEPMTGARARDALVDVRRSIRQLDAKLDQRTGGEWSLNGLLFYGLLGASAYQVFRGDLFPAAGTLLMQAMHVLRQGSADVEDGD